MIVNNAKFVLVAQTQWKPPEPDDLDESFPMVAPIEIQLHITNLSKAGLAPVDLVCITAASDRLSAQACRGMGAGSCP